MKSGRLLRVLGLLASLVGLALVVRSLDVSTTVNTLAGAQPGPLALCLLVVTAQVVLRSARWRILLPARLDGVRIPLPRIAGPLLVGYLGNAALPARLGEVARAVLIARRERLDTAAALGSVVLERVVDTASLAIVGLVAATEVGAPSWIGQLCLVAAAGLVLAVALMATVGLSPGTRRIGAIATRLHAGRRAAVALASLDTFARGLDRAARPSRVVAAATISVFCWGLDATLVWLVAESLGIPMTPAGAMLVAAIAILGTAIPSAPGYIGTFDLAAATTAGALGIDPSAAAVLAVLYHAVSLLPTAIGGGVALIAMDMRLSDTIQLARGEAASTDASAEAQPGAS